MSKYVITDLDGTVANCWHRLHLICDIDENGNTIQRENISSQIWEKFNRGCLKDEPIEPVIKLLRSMHAHGYKIAVCSSRSSVAISETEEWWFKNVGIPVVGGYHLRPANNNYISDVELKREWAIRNKAIIDNTLFVLEDRTAVVKMWRKLGLMCLQVTNGDY